MDTLVAGLAFCTFASIVRGNDTQTGGPRSDPGHREAAGPNGCGTLRAVAERAADTLRRRQRPREAKRKAPEPRQPDAAGASTKRRLPPSAKGRFEGVRLYEFTCGVTSQKSIDDVLAASSLPCHPLGRNIARRLVWVAAQRIFSDPTQAIVELVVNSLDAYGHVPKVGRFGMGFFSLLYYVRRSEEDRLTVTSTHAEGGLRTSIEVGVWRGGADGELRADLSWEPAGAGAATGTTVHIATALTEDEQRRMEAHVDRLKFHGGGLVRFRRTYGGGGGGGAPPR